MAAVAVVGNQQGNPDDLAAGQAVHLLTRSGQLLLHYGIDPPSSTQKMIPENHHSSGYHVQKLQVEPTLMGVGTAVAGIPTCWGLPILSTDRTTKGESGRGIKNLATVADGQNRGRG